MEAAMKRTIGGAVAAAAAAATGGYSRRALLPRGGPALVAARTLVKRCPVSAGHGGGGGGQQRLTAVSDSRMMMTTQEVMGSRSTVAVAQDERDGASTPDQTEATAGLKTIADLDGPRGWPVVGNFLTYLKKENRGKMHEVQARLHKTYGRMFREKWGTNWQVHLSDPSIIEVVYRHEGRYPHRPPLEPWILYRQLVNKPYGLFTAQGSEWHLYRTELSKRMLCPQTTKGLIDPVSRVADDLVKRLRHVRDTDGELALVRRLPNEMYKWSLEAAGTFLFETRLGCLDQRIPARTQQFIDVTQEMLTSSLYLIVGERLHQRLNTRFWRRHQAAWDTMFQIGKELIDKRIKELLEERKEGRQTNCGVFLTYLLANNKISMDQVHSNITELLVAGTDTMANSFCFITHLLATHPAVQDRLYEELTNVLGSQELNRSSSDGTTITTSSSSSEDDEVTSAALEEMKFLKCVIKESMRLYPVATMNCRILDEDIVLNGHLIPKKTLIVVNHYASGHDDDVFPNASQFLPDRWMREESADSSGKHHPFACLPFGFGKRNCVGQRVAKVELMIALVKVLRQFRLETYPGIEFNPVLRTLLTPGEHVPVRFVDRFTHDRTRHE